MPATASAEELKLYYDYKSPFTYLVAEPALALPERFAVGVRWIPFVLRLKGPGQRSIYSDWKARYSYMDARRAANRRGGFRIMGPPKIYDSGPALGGARFSGTRGVCRGARARERGGGAGGGAGARAARAGRRGGLPRVPGGRRAEAARCLRRGGARRPCLRRADLRAARRAVLGQRPASPPRGAARGVRPQSLRRTLLSFSFLQSASRDS